MLNIHRDVSDILHNEVFRDVLQVHGMGIPYPAELWIDGSLRHEHGTAMFNIGDRGRLIAEYFGYDGFGTFPTLSIGLEQSAATLIIKGTQVEIPIRRIYSSPKASTLHDVPMPSITAYECEIYGQLGEPNSEMTSASMTITGLPDVHLFQTTSPTPPEGTAGGLTLRGFKKQVGELNMGAGEWQVNLMASHENGNVERQHLYHITVRRKDESPFRLEDGVNRGIVGALRLFLSFQCERWVDMPTIVGNPVFSTIEKRLMLRSGETSESALSAIQKFRQSPKRNADVVDELCRSLQNTPGFEDVSDAYILSVAVNDERATVLFGSGDPTKTLAWVSRLSSPATSSDNMWTATDVEKWPTLFDGFWRQLTDERDAIHLENAVYHYVETSRIFHDGALLYSLVTAQSTLQAVVRWWQGLAQDFHFSHRDGERFKDLLLETVRKAELGKDQERSLDEKSVAEVVDQMSAYRNKIDHGHAVNLDQDVQAMANLQMFCHNLARLLLLAKFGVRDTDQRGYVVGPRFKESQY